MQTSNRTFTHTYDPNHDSSLSVEMSQRLVIKYLNNTLSRLLTNNQNLSVGCNNEYVPNDEGDRVVWYLELLESQLGKVELINLL